MRTRAPALLPLLLLLVAGPAAAAAATLTPHDDTLPLTPAADDSAANDTLPEGALQPVVRHKRTFGELVFRGLADVLGYNVQRRQQQVTFPPPLAPIPGLDNVQAGPAPAPPCAAPQAAPCNLPVAAAPPPCPLPRAAPPPPPAPAPPCPAAPANPAQAPPCGAPLPKQDAPVETVSSNLQLSFNLNRNRPTAAPAAAAPAPAPQAAPVPLEPRAAPLPPEPQRALPRVYLDAVVVRDGVAQRAMAYDRAHLRGRAPPPPAADADYLADDEDAPAEDPDDYEEPQESRDKAVRDFGTAVGQFWGQKRPSARYRRPSYGQQRAAVDVADDSGEQQAEPTTSTQDPRRALRPRVLPRTENSPGHIDTVTVRVPPIYRDKNPRKLYHGGDHHYEQRDDGGDLNEELQLSQSLAEAPAEAAAEAPVSPAPRKRKRKKRRRQRRTPRLHSAEQSDEQHDERPDDAYSAADYDYYGNPLPISDEEKMYRRLQVADPTPDPDRARVEAAQSGADEQDELSDPVRITDPERMEGDPERMTEAERADDSGRADSAERLAAKDLERGPDSERMTAADTDRADSAEREREQADAAQRADSRERSDALSPRARVHETGYSNRFVHATDVRVHDPRSPLVHKQGLAVVS